jgi:hypothetical protein
MSAIGPKRTQVSAPHMSAFGSKADMTLCGNAFAVAIGGKADMPFCTAYVRFCPKADIGAAAFQSPNPTR